MNDSYWNLLGISLLTVFGMVIGYAIGYADGLKGNIIPDASSAEGIDLNSKCPACGHRGCTLEYVEPHEIQVGEKREIRVTDPMVARTCITCKAKSYEKTALPSNKWIAK